MAELERMENCEEYQYINSLNIFSMTLGPFDKEVTKAVTEIKGKGDKEDGLQKKDETIIGVVTEEG
jgi:hypothetical protein